METTQNHFKQENNFQKNDDIVHSQSFAALLPNVPLMLLVLNQDRELVYANKLFEQRMQQSVHHTAYEHKRPGDCFGCLHAISAPKGCGTTHFCEFCGLAEAIKKAEKEDAATGECRLEMHDGNAMVFKVHGYAFTHESQRYLFLALEDISDQKARKLLENIFLHDLNNSLSILLSLPDILDELDPALSKKILKEISMRMNDEIKSYQIISAAENQQLCTRHEKVYLQDLAKQLVESITYSQKFSKKSAELELINEPVTTDKTILRQVLYNMVKNAMEAGTQEETIKIYSNFNEINNRVTISVRNAQVMPYAAQMQVFKKTFSTKGANRGWGTYSIKLLTEKYLKGRAFFSSNEAEGTIFSIELPCEPELSPAEAQLSRQNA